MLVFEPVEHAGGHEALTRFVRILRARVLKVNEHLVRIIGAPEDPLHLCLLSSTWLILVEHRPPPVVIAGLDTSDDERWHSGRFLLVGLATLQFDDR